MYKNLSFKEWTYLLKGLIQFWVPSLEWKLAKFLLLIYLFDFVINFKMFRWDIEWHRNFVTWTKGKLGWREALGKWGETVFSIGDYWEECRERLRSVIEEFLRLRVSANTTKPSQICPTSSLPCEIQITVLFIGASVKSHVSHKERKQWQNNKQQQK